MLGPDDPETGHGRRAVADGRLERIREVVGSDALSDLAALDVSDDLQVDRAAAALLKRFHDADDVAAFRLLVELTSDRLAALSEGLAAELGLGTDAYELVTNFFSRLFINLKPRDQAPLHFLVAAVEKLKVDAETIIRDLALGEVPDPEEPTICEDGKPKAHNNAEALVAHATRIGFHRLDLPYRRVLRAKDTAGLSTSDIANELGVSFVEVEELLQTARERLARAIDDVLKGPSS